ncbi:hypothetical protein [Aeromonas salmonicida]|uniref:hypothetical protein n=1 Tax=Aeromonas salmonicida TaxID=645 RepID=UPI001BA49C87|nr:hypothetical protein [Aeromonas salmonicida]MBS2781045.1 hypothetical protein [Aeromonas salmonicida]
MRTLVLQILFLSLALYHSLSPAIPVTILPATEGNFITIVDRDNIYVGALTGAAKITGSTRFTSHPDHGGLVYMGDGKDRNIPELSAGFMYNVEIWEDNPVVASPYLGLHCWKYQVDCESSIYKPGSTLIRDNGFRVVANRDSRVINPRLSQGYVNYLTALPVGNKFSTDMNYCWSMNSGQEVNCKSNQDAVDEINKWEKRRVTFTKQGQLRIENSPFTVDLMISSSGDFWILPGSRDCENISPSGQSGIACRFATYDLQLAAPPVLDTITLTPSIKNSRLSNTALGDLQISTDRHIWYKQGDKMPFSELKKSDSIYVFMSKEMLKKISSIAPPRNLRNMFSLVVGNSLHAASGLYEIMGSADVHFTSRQMSVTIREKDGLTHPVKSGTVGRDKLEFEYIISESATAPSESLEISVRQDTGTPYKGNCTFYPPNHIDQNMAVAIPARILFTDRIGDYKNISIQINCDGSPLDLRKNKIIETSPAIPWTEESGVNGAIRFYDISLLFDLRHSLVPQTIGGETWEGEVYQSGTISVKSVWK